MSVINVLNTFYISFIPRTNMLDSSRATLTHTEDIGRRIGRLGGDPMDETNRQELISQAELDELDELARLEPELARQLLKALLRIRAGGEETAIDLRATSRWSPLKTLVQNPRANSLPTGCIINCRTGEGLTMKTDASFKGVLIAGLALLYLAPLAFFLMMEGRASGAPIGRLVGNGLLLSIPLLALCAMIYVLATAARQVRAGGALDRRLVGGVYWAPRLAGIAIILFISLFALDVFTPGIPLDELLLGLLMHLIPSIGLAVILALAWKWEWIGFWFFLLAALLFTLTFLRDALMGLGNMILFSGPLLLIALLFGANWRWKGQMARG